MITTDLFLKSGAEFSACGSYRYALWRIWDESQPAVMWIGLNPSTADETQDDPTIRRCKAFAAAWGYGGIYMLNLFAFRATQPKVMMQAGDPIGPANYSRIAEYHEVAGLTVACWGTHGGFQDQDVCVSRLDRVGPHAKTRYVGDDLWCLKMTKDGFPQHPLYVPANVERKRFRVRTRNEP